MTDPFTFDTNKTHKETEYEGGFRRHTYSYRLPDGSVVGLSGEDSDDVLSRLEEDFLIRTRGLSAHERIEWVAGWKALP